MASTALSPTWHKVPIMGGLYMFTTEVSLRERPKGGTNPVATTAIASVAPDFDWKTNGVLWGVTFRRRAPRNPLIPRQRKNPRTGQMEEHLPPPAIPERHVSGRVHGDDLEAAMLEGRLQCEKTLQAGRPSGPVDAPNAQVSAP